MSDINDLQKDEQGYIICKPIKELMATAIAGTSVLLVVRYIDSPEQLQKDEFGQIQFGLTPQQCLDLANLLQKAAGKIPGDSTAQRFEV